jgi:hypothetical protein
MRSEKPKEKKIEENKREGYNEQEKVE